MLDTIILTMPIDYSCIIDHSRFKPSTEKIFEGNYFIKYVNNPTADDWRKKIYKPRLTAYKRGKIIELKVEFSAPKLLFGNNLDELQESDFEQVRDKLQEALRAMGVKVFGIFIENAKVSGFSPSKNIPLSNGYTSIFAIRELNKLDVSKKFDLADIKYQNGGEELQIYTNSHSLVFYDKINDLNKPAKRAIDKDQAPKQFSLFEQIKKQKNPIEVLRVEARLSKKRIINEALVKLGYLQNPTFKDIFNKDLCQKVLLSYWERFFSDNLFLFDVQDKPQKIFQNILAKHGQKIGVSRAIYLTGFLTLCKDDAGMRGFRQIAENYKPKTNWTQLKKWLAAFQRQITATRLHGFVADIERELKEFRPFKLPKNLSTLAL